MLLCIVRCEVKLMIRVIGLLLWLIRCCRVVLSRLMLVGVVLFIGVRLRLRSICGVVFVLLFGWLSMWNLVSGF